jgi:hypothetical protein
MRMALAAILVSVLVASAVAGALPVSRAAEPNGQEKALRFLSDMVMLDLSEYNLTLRSYDVTYPDEYGGSVAREDVTFRLQANDSHVTANCLFVNDTFTYCFFGWSTGSLIYLQTPPTDVVDSASAKVRL